MRIMVLDDGETYSALDGCKLVEVPSTFPDLDEGEQQRIIQQAANAYPRVYVMDVWA